MNAQVEFPFRLRSTPFCRFRVRRRFHLLRLHSTNACIAFFCFVASPFRCVCIPFRCICIPFRSGAFRGVCVARQQVFVQYFLRFLLSFIAERNLPFLCCLRYRLFFVRSSVFRGFVVLFSWICRPFFVDLSFVFRLSFKRSLSVRCTFNAHFALAFAQSENGKGLFNYGCGFWLYTERRSAVLPRFSENAGVVQFPAPLSIFYIASKW